jgi:tripartite-type tricarboxylate transporter receptor subunit TctC
MNKAKFGFATAMAMAIIAVSLISGECATKQTPYPTRSIKLVAPFAPGGPVDLVGRAYAEALKPLLPQPVEVVNKPGGGGVTGTVDTITSKPDGYTLVLNTSMTVAATPQLQTDMPLKGPQDVTPIITGFIVSNVFCVGADQPWKTMKELLAYAKANPGKVRIAHAGIGSPTHTHLAHLEMVAGVDFTDVPQGGAAPAVTAVLGNQIEGLVLNATAVDAQVKAGKMRVLATYTTKRLTDLDPNAPTFKELGYNVMTEGSTFVVMGPKDLPRDIVNVLYNGFRKAQDAPAFQSFVKKNLILVDDRGVDEWTKQLRDDYKFYGTFLKQIGLLK